MKHLRQTALSKVAFATLLLLFTSSSLALDNGLGLTPQMGWNTWNKFGCKINENLIKETADYIVKLGLDKVGYQYVNVDDCWLTENRTSDGHIEVDSKAFPSGMKSLSDYIHSKGLKFGLYSSAGYFSCEHRAGSMGNEEQDAKSFASWGVDYIKYDNCNHGGQPNYPRFKKMSDELIKTGRPIFFSICNWGDENAPVWGKEVGNSWRTTQDIFNHFTSVEYNFNQNQKFAEHAGPGHWNDPDMLQIGNNGMTPTEERTHFALWSIAKGPLIMGNDLQNIRPESLAILKNEEVIAINQDTFGKQGLCAVNCGPFEFILRRPQVIAAPLANGDIAAVIVNWRELNYGEFSFNVQDIGLNLASGESYQVRDLWEHKTLGPFTSETFKVDSIPGHGNHALRFSRVQKKAEFTE